MFNRDQHPQHVSRDQFFPAIGKYDTHGLFLKHIVHEFEPAGAWCFYIQLYDYFN